MRTMLSQVNARIPLGSVHPQFPLMSCSRASVSAS
ncbi:hypothetical protein MPTA5024_04485 [Microbispora sp. ATCC PTA-5024]|nr:hypothetical protein MPTA5024_04485 [Microbispora sp. ATCC PTA-5024]